MRPAPLPFYLAIHGVAVALVACGTDTFLVAPTDAAIEHPGSKDAGFPKGSGASDASLVDSSDVLAAADPSVPLDAGLVDSGFPDVGWHDASTRDGASHDALSSDAGHHETGHDAASPDAGGVQDAQEATDARAKHDAMVTVADSVDAGPAFFGYAKTFALLAGSGVTISATPPASTFTGDMGVSPGTMISTLPPGEPQQGSVYQGGPIAAQAQTDLASAYDALARMPCPTANNVTSGTLGGMTLPPGVYCFDSTANLTGALILDAQQDASARWVFQVGSSLTVAAASTVTVINGGLGCNVYWQLGASATVGAGAALVGNVVAMTDLTLAAGASIAPGRALARNGEITITSNNIAAAACQ